MSDPNDRAEELFAELVQRLERGEELDLAASIQAEDASLQPRLRELVDAHRRCEAELVLAHPIEEPELLFPPRSDSDAPGSNGSRSVFFRRHERARVAPADGFAPGRVVGDFRLVALVAQGGMGQVWEARQLSLGGRKVALKFVRPERVTPRSLEFFHREARAGGRLSHPAIVAIHGHGESDGASWIAMEFVEGAWTLADFIGEAAARLQVPEGYDRYVAGFVAELADALQVAHDAGVIHRDLKPGNVLVTSQDRPKLTDFGLARIVDESALSHTGEFAGSYFYMSPEQAAAKRMGIDHRTDVFSLGVVMYEMLTLQRPFQGDTSHQVTEQILTKEPPDPRAIRSRVPSELAVVCGKALEKDRGRRYQSMRELADDLRRWLADRPIHAKPPTRVERVRKWARRNPTKSVAGALGAAAFAVIAALLFQTARANDALRERTGELEVETRAVKRLSALQDLEDLVAAAGDPERMWPALPSRIPAYRAWIDEARRLVAALPEHRAKRDELRRRALPRTEDERLADRRGHPDFPRYVALAGAIESARRALVRRRDGVEAELPELDPEEHPDDPELLVAMAARRVRPDRELLGEEPLGLALALRALELTEAARAPSAEAQSTLASAYFALGCDDDALNAAYEATQTAPEEREVEFLQRMVELERAIGEATTEEGLERSAAALRELEAERAALDSRLDERAAWLFPEDEQATEWWHDQLTKLIDGLEALEDPRRGLLSAEGISPEHGWCVPKRLAFAQRLELAYSPDGEFDARWSAALPGIRAAYPELEIERERWSGLVPLGRDRNSGLWEFWDVATGAEPGTAELGFALKHDDAGMVMVLLPGGSFWMGAQASDPAGQNYDPLAQPWESPVHRVVLSPFLISKYEMTQGQWVRLNGTNPSSAQPGREGIIEPSLRDPVEQVSWFDCLRALARIGASLPTNAQWEYAARAGTDTPWWSGFERDSLRTVRAANLADRSAAREGASWPAIQTWPENDDLFPDQAPVGSFMANPFGLHDVLGNVREWCLDGEHLWFYLTSPVHDPLAAPDTSPCRIVRGGSFKDAATDARSAVSDGSAPSNADRTVGVRPARTL